MPEEAAEYPQLPDDWHTRATIHRGQADRDHPPDRDRETLADPAGRQRSGIAQPKCFLSTSKLLGTPVSASSFPSNSSEIQPR